MEKHVTPLGLVDGYTSFLQICHPSGIFSHGIEKPPAERFEASVLQGPVSRGWCLHQPLEMPLAGDNISERLNANLVRGDIFVEKEIIKIHVNYAIIDNC